MSGDIKPASAGDATDKKLDAATGAKSIMGQSPDQIESLLRFLIYLVLHKEKMSPEEYKKGGQEVES